MKINELYPAVTVLLLAALVLAVGVMTLDTMRETVEDTISTDQNITLNGTTQSLTFTEEVVNCIVTNATDSSQSLATDQYTCTAAGRITLTNDTSTFNNTLTNVAYDFDQNSAGSNALNLTGDALGDFNDWLPLIVLIISAVIILGLVLGTMRT